MSFIEEDKLIKKIFFLKKQLLKTEQLEQITSRVALAEPLLKWFVTGIKLNYTLGLGCSSLLGTLFGAAP